MALITNKDTLRAPVCHWDKLPTELKLHVFSYLGLVSKKAKDLFSESDWESFTSLCLTSHEFRTLVHDTWFKGNYYRIERPAQGPICDKDEKTYDAYLGICFPSPQISLMVRNVQLRLCVDYSDSLDDLFDVNEYNEWSFLVRRCSFLHSLRPQENSPDKWQALFPFLENLSIVLCFDEGVCNKENWHRRAPLIDVLGETEIPIRAERVQVSIDCHADCEEHGNHFYGPNVAGQQWITETIQGMVKKHGD